METLETLKTRRSCRAFKADMLPEDVISTIAEAGSWAPTGMGKQSPKIVVVTNKEVRDELSAMNAEIMGVDFDPFYGAPVVLVVLANADVPTCVEDGSLVMGNLQNAAADQGIGSCWIHRAKQEFDSERGKQLLAEWGIEGNYVGVGHCILGYPAEGGVKEPADRKADYVTWVR